MAEARDYYDVLGVSRDATPEQIRRAHRRLAREHHPDVSKSPDAAARFNEIQTAYDVLSDPQKRKAYDRFGHAGVGAAHAGAPGGGGGGGARTWTWTGSGPGGGAGAGFDPGEFASVFEEFFGPEASQFGRRSGHAASGGAGASPFSGQRARRAARGSDVQHPLEVGFLTAALGGTQQIRLTSGETTQTIDVKIPPGIDSGATLRMRGRGQPGAGPGAQPGDLLLTVQVQPHPYFRRQGLDLFLDVPITIAEAALGTKVTVPLLKGTAQIKVPRGAGSGRKLRVKGKGIADSQGRSGDFYAVIQIVAPTGLSDEDEQALQDMSERLRNPRQGGPWAEGSDAED